MNELKKYYRKNYIKKEKLNGDIKFQIIEWNCNDYNEDDIDSEEEQQYNSQLKQYNGKYVIRCYGATLEGISISCEILDFTPFFYVKVRDNFNKNDLRNFIKFIKTSYQLSKCKIEEEWYSLTDGLIEDKCIIIEKKDIFGFSNNKLFRFIRLVFKNQITLNKCKYIFKNPVIIPNVNNNPEKYKLYESNFEPFMRYGHIQEILMAGWVLLPDKKYKIINDINSTTHYKVNINWKDIKSLKEKEIANFLQMSWDIEVYSYDKTFPDPLKKVNNKYPNEIFQIGCTFKYYNEENIMLKYLLTLKKCEKIEDKNTIVDECENEKELIKKWYLLIKNMDPDILYTYNGDTFDCMYIYERLKIYNMEEELLKNISRDYSIQTLVKKETFSSSAYGDSDYLRFYITGRLNYDLLIHYKRGMKKYPSYKLDYIANEILKEGKHDVSAKQIFQYYEEGTPEKIRIIGEYCLMDTELLQKLVDKQLILITIIQLANVTYVPISYLLTRGQTIKVYSQILRKARQMNYLVPHTNFNEDSYPLQIHTKEEHNLDDEDIGNYIKINCGRNYNSQKKLLQINGKISEIIDNTHFIVLSNVELEKDESFTSKYTYKHMTNKQIITLTTYDDISESSFTGATVLTAIPNIYEKNNIAVLDFASLYPTIMISRNLCYSTFIREEKYMLKDIPEEEGIYKINDTIYERIKWDDKIEYLLKHTCEGIGKSGKNKDNICGKQAYFEVTDKEILEKLNEEIIKLKEEKENLEEKDEIKKISTKIKLKEKELKLFENSVDMFDILKSKYYCRVHDPLKNNRLPEEKYQKKDVHYNYVIVQPEEINENGKIIKKNQGVLPALLEELYSERKKVKKEMNEAIKQKNKLYEDILNSTQLAIKVSLNSVYGYLGRGQGNMILKELGSIVTAIGRKLIQESKNYSETEFIELINKNNLLTQKIEYNDKLIKNINENEKEIILSQFTV